MTNNRRETGYSSKVLRSIWSWDLWLALIAGFTVAVASIITDIQPKRAWIAPVFVLSCAVLTIAVRERTNLRNRLRCSNYGELLHVIDQTRDRSQDAL